MAPEGVGFAYVHGPARLVRGRVRLGVGALALLVLLAFDIVTASLPATAQQPAGKTPRVGVISPGNPPTGDPFRQREAFEAGLRDLGWIPGSNILIEYRYAGGNLERLPALADELVNLPVDVIVARAPASIRATQRATRTIPIVMSVSVNPVREGFVASLARPGGNITGLTLLVEDLDGKQLELLRETLPRLTRVGILRNPDSGAEEYVEVRQKIEMAARALRLEITEFPVRLRGDLAPAFAAMRKARVGAVLVRADPLVLEPNRVELVALGLKHKLPSIHTWRQFVEAGSLMSYGVNLSELHRRSASYVDKILKGARPADLPVEQPTKFELVINRASRES